VRAGAIASPIVELDLGDLIDKDTATIGVTRFEPQVFQNLLEYIRPLVIIKNQINYRKEIINYFPLLPTPYSLLPLFRRGLLKKVY